MQWLPALAGVVLVSLSCCAQATETDGIYFSHHDWEVACDNTGTCRAAGYQGYDSRAVSVLLTRKAGPGEPVTGKLRIGEWELDRHIVDALRSDRRLWLHLDGERVGQVEIDLGTLMADLPEAVVGSLLAALQGDSVIEWVHGGTRWRLSGTGATAVLSKMDDVQERAETPGAVVRKGSRNEGKVPRAEPAPVVIAQSLAGGAGRGQPWKAAHLPAVRAALRANTGNDDECIGLAEPDKGGEELSVIRLSAGRLLVSTTCWTAAYNMGNGYWTINDAPPYEPVLVTRSGSYFEGSTLTATHKGRGLGDCWSTDHWTWNGQRLVHTASFTTGKCRLVAAGGAWTLPTLVTEVRREPGK